MAQSGSKVLKITFLEPASSNTTCTALSADSFDMCFLESGLRPAAEYFIIQMRGKTDRQGDAPEMRELTRHTLLNGVARQLAWTILLTLGYQIARSASLRLCRTFYGSSKQKLACTTLDKKSLCDHQRRASVQLPMS